MWFEHLNRGNEQSLNLWLTAKSSTSTLNWTKYESSDYLRCPCGGGFKLKVFYRFNIFILNHRKRKKCSFSFMQISFWSVYFCLKICQYISSKFTEVIPPKTLNVAS